MEGDRLENEVPSPRPESKRVVFIVAGSLLALLGGSLGYGAWRRAQPPPPLPELQPVEAADLHGYWQRPPRLIKGPLAALPERNLADMTPTIMCRGLVGLDGHVQEARVLRPRRGLTDYEEKALEAFREYEFQPGQLRDRQIRAWINWPVGFRDPAHPTGALRLKGSDTIGGELAPRLAEAFHGQHPELAVTVAALGTSTAFTGLFDGTADIGMASRPATSDELMRAAFLGIRLREHVFGHDAIAVIVHPGNAVHELSLAQLRRIFTGEVSNWRQLGGPNLPVRRFSRPSYSGTHSFFKQRVMGSADAHGEFARDTTWVERSEELVERVAGAPGAIGFVGFGHVRRAVRAVALSEGGPAVAPAAATVTDRTYPITRPLLLYTRGAPSKEAADFLQFVFTQRAQSLVQGAGFVPHEETTLVVTPRAVPQRLGYELLRLHFAEGQATLQPSEKDRMARAVDAMSDPENYAMVVGNAASDEGDPGVVAQLADARARAVAAVLQKSVTEARIVVRSDGSAQPVSSNDKPEGRAENRRVDVFVVHRPDIE